MKKKIIFVTEALWIGGIETALVNLLDRLDYDRYEVTCLVARGCLELADRVPSACRLLVADRERTFTFRTPYRHSRLYHLTEESAHPSRLHRAMQWTVPAIRWAENRLYIRYVRRQLAEERFDTCVIYSDRTAELAARAVNADRFLLFYHHGAMRREYHDEVGYRRAERVIAVSPGLAEQLRAYRPRWADKIIAIHNLTDASGVRTRSLAPPDTVFPTDTLRIVSCGRLSPAKGMDLAAEACALLVQRGFTGFHWYIIGGGPEESALGRQIEALGIGGSVTLLGMRENPYPYLRQADIYVQPSRFEGHCVTVLEARLLALPILATRPAAYEQLRHGEDGLLCQPDAQSIADGVERLCRDPALRESFRRAQLAHDFEADNNAVLQSLYALL